MYTVHFEQSKENETDSFIARFAKDPKYARDFNTIIYWINKIGQTGVLERYFRSEGRAVALPIETSKLRFYCYRINDHNIVLGNGGIKTSKKVQDSPDCLPHFRLMNHVAKKIHWAFEDQQILLSPEKGLEGKLTFNYNENE
jgi:hypothetical protein